MYASSHFLMSLLILGFVRFKIVAVEMWSLKDEDWREGWFAFLNCLTPQKSEKCFSQWIYIDAMLLLD